METRMPASERTSQKLSELLTQGVAEGEPRSELIKLAVRKRWMRSGPGLAGGRRTRVGSHGGAHTFGVSPVEVLANRAQLPLLELADGDAAPPVGRPDHRRVHQLQDRALAERVRVDLRAPALLGLVAKQESIPVSLSSKLRTVAGQ